jgi:hypothetical protein
MTRNESKTVTPVKAATTTDTREGREAPPRAYHSPELLVVGKAVELVQGGGGGNYSDANRSRYY